MQHTSMMEAMRMRPGNSSLSRLNSSSIVSSGRSLISCTCGRTETREIGLLKAFATAVLTSAKTHVASLARCDLMPKYKWQQ